MSRLRASTSSTPRVRRPSLLLGIAVLLALAVLAATPCAAQSTLGTIRGTVSDAQGAVVPGATVVVTDEDTGVAREVVSTSRRPLRGAQPAPGQLHGRRQPLRFQGREADGHPPRRRPWHAPTSSSKSARSRMSSPWSPRARTITVESPSIARGLDAQQLRDLPRNSRDIQDFLTLNPNVVGGFDSIQFLGGRTYGASYIQDGQPSSAGSSVNCPMPHRAWTPSRKCRCSPTRTARSSAASPVSSSRPSAAPTRSRVLVLRLQHDELNARTYAQTLNHVSRDDPNADTHDHRFGFSIGGPIHTNRTFFFGNYEGGRLKALGGGAQAIVPSQSMRAGDFTGSSFVIGIPRPASRSPTTAFPRAA